MSNIVKTLLIAAKNYFLGNPRNIGLVLFTVLSLFFGARVEPFKDPTISFLEKIGTLLVPGKVEVIPSPATETPEAPAADTPSQG